MKKAFFLCLSFYAFTNLFAQPIRLSAAAFVNGSFGFNKSKTDASVSTTSFSTTTTAFSVTETKNTNFSLDWGVFAFKNFALGLSGNSVKSESTINMTKNPLRTDGTKSWSVGPLVRYYLPFSKGFGIAFDGTAQWGKATTETPMNVIVVQNHGKLFGVRFSPIVYLIFGRLGMELELGGYKYSRLNFEPEVTSGVNFSSTTSNTQVNSGFDMNLQNIRIGLTCYIGKKQD